MQSKQNGQSKMGMNVHATLFEVYVTDPYQISSEDELITEVYYPIRKI